MASDDVSPCLFIALSTVIDLATWAKNKPPAVFKKEKKTPADRNSAYLCIYIFFPTGPVQNLVSEMEVEVVAHDGEKERKKKKRRNQLGLT